MEPAEGEPYVAPATPAAVLAGLDSLTGDAAAAHTAFLAKAGTVTRTVSAARGSGPGSDAWALAQIALAELESERSRAMIALADLDRLYVAAATDGSTLDQIAAARAEVERMVAAETETVDQLLVMISPRPSCAPYTQTVSRALTKL